MDRGSKYKGVASINQILFSDMEYSGQKRVTQKEEFMREMNEIIPQVARVSKILPYCRDAYRNSFAEKGYNSNCMAARMAMANLYKDVGMDTVRWNLNSDERAEFIDKDRNVYSFDEIFEKMKALPHR